MLGVSTRLNPVTVHITTTDSIYVNDTLQVQTKISRVGSSEPTIFGPSSTSKVIFPVNQKNSAELQVRANDDFYALGIRNGTIHFRVECVDPVFSMLNLSDITVGMVDNDQGALRFVGEGSTNVMEAGTSSDIYKIYLSTPPSAPVTVTPTNRT